MLRNLYWKSVENLVIKIFWSIEEVCLLLHILRCPGRNFSWNLISGGVEQECPGWKFFAKLIGGGTSIRDLRVQKHCQGQSIKYVRIIYRKSSIFYFLIRTCTCTFQRLRNATFSVNFAYVLYGAPYGV